MILRVWWLTGMLGLVLCDTPLHFLLFALLPTVMVRSLPEGSWCGKYCRCCGSGSSHLSSEPFWTAMAMHRLSPNQMASPVGCCCQPQWLQQWVGKAVYEAHWSTCSVYHDVPFLARLLDYHCPFKEIRPGTDNAMPLRYTGISPHHWKV